MKATRCLDNVIQTRATINYLIKSNYEPYPWSIEFSLIQTF